MALTPRQKKYINKHRKLNSIDQIARALGIAPAEVASFLGEPYAPKDPHKNSLGKLPASELPHTSTRAWLTKHAHYLIILVGLIIAAYANSLTADFVSDDIPLYVTSNQVSQLDDLWAGPFPMRAITNFITYSFFGLEPFAFRLMNILFHTGSVFFALLISALFVPAPVALMAASLFAVHPILTESVTWISGGVYAQGGFFALGAIYFYIKGRSIRTRLILSLLFFIFAILSSEKMMVVPGILLFYEFLLGNLRRRFYGLIPFFALSGLWALKFVGQISNRVTSLSTEYYQSSAEGLHNPLVQIPTAIVSYIKLIFWPFGLSLYHPDPTSGILRFTVIWIIFGVLVGLYIWSFRKNKVIFFFASLFWIALAVTLTPLKIAWVVAERYVYLGSFGIFFIINYGFYLGLKKWKNKTAIYTIFAILIALLTIRTIVRNVDWQTEDSLYLSLGKTAPNYANTHNNLGDVYGRQGDYQRAIQSFKRAIELNPRYAAAYHNMGNTYVEMQQYDKALESYHKALEIDPALWQSYQLIALIHFEKKDFDTAFDYMRNGLKASPNNIVLQINLGALYLEAGRKAEAAEAFEKALLIDPTNEKARAGLEASQRKSEGESN